MKTFSLLEETVAIVVAVFGGWALGIEYPASWPQAATLPAGLFALFVGCWLLAW